MIEHSLSQTITMEIAQAALSNEVVLEPSIVTLAVADPDVLAAMAEYPDGPARTNFLVTALKVGVLSLKAARGTLDGDTLRREGDRFMKDLGERLNSWRSRMEERMTGSLSLYFDPQQGSFTERVQRLVKDDGDLAMVIKRQVQDGEANLAKVFEQFVGENSQLLRALDPGKDNQLVGTLQRALDAVVQQQNQEILGQFSLDNKDSALVRFLGELTTRHGDLSQALSRDMKSVVSEFSLDREDSALSRLVSRVETAQKSITEQLSLDADDSALQRLHRLLLEHQRDVAAANRDLAARLDGAIQAMNARRDESAKSTRHGLEFEATLSDHLREIVAAAGDILQDTGATTGLRPNCKVGDHVITIGPEKLASGARIVVEAKESASYDLARTLEEAQVARENRQAGMCIFVHSVKTAPATIPEFQRFGHDLVVKWNADDDANDAWLRAALMVAVALSVKAASHDKKDAASFAKIDGAIERIRKHLTGLDEITTLGNTQKNAAEKILNRARLMQEGLATQLQDLLDETTKLKEDAAKD